MIPIQTKSASSTRFSIQAAPKRPRHLRRRCAHGAAQAMSDLSKEVKPDLRSNLTYSIWRLMGLSNYISIAFHNPTYNYTYEPT